MVFPLAGGFIVCFSVICHSDFESTNMNCGKLIQTAPVMLLYCIMSHSADTRYSTFLEMYYTSVCNLAFSGKSHFVCLLILIQLLKW